ncbi:hypothetical protein PHLCEN_2v2339 [Hermanssonia centrifuga]|nr:hypothetical protein PHLCEN_2v2339 [Hermanssonia centrifuga]
MNVLFRHPLGVTLLSALTCVSVLASPTKRQTLSALTQAQVSSFKPYTYYASAAHCPASETLTWSCGVNCQANPTFEPVASGGDGDSEQFWYVGYDPTLRTVIVGHQGTNTSELLPLLTDGDIVLGNLDSTLFPGISSSIGVHEGFREAQAK